MTKEEKIKEDWKSNFEEFSEYIDSDGWALYPHFQKHEMIEDVRPIVFHKTGLHFRPKSLEGIENNNGWIKIESEADLPKESFDCYFITNHSDNTIMRGFFNSNSKSIYGTHKEYNINEINHYQPIEKPKPPIY